MLVKTGKIEIWIGVVEMKIGLAVTQTVLIRSQSGSILICIASIDVQISPI